MFRSSVKFRKMLIESNIWRHYKCNKLTVFKCDNAYSFLDTFGASISIV